MEWPAYIFPEDEWPEEVEPPAAAEAQPPAFCPELGLLGYEYEEPASPLSALKAEISVPRRVVVEEGDEVQILGDDYVIARIYSCRIEVAAKIYSLLLEPT